MEHPLEKYRSEFLTLQEKIYLNSCSLGPLPRRSMRYFAEYQRHWLEKGSLAWEDEWFPETQRIKTAFGRVMGAAAAELAIMPNVSAGLTMVGSLVDFSKRKKVVVHALDFPTTVHQWLVKQRLGVEVVMVPSEDGVTVPAERVAAAVDADTALVCTTHIIYSTGYIQDMQPIAEACRRHGALLCVDGYHAVGSLDFDVGDLGCDFYTAGVLKWLMGGPGLAFLWVHPRHHGLTPTATSWLASAEPFDFDNRHWEPAADARRFEFGTPPVPNFYIARGGLELINEIGMPAVRRRQVELCRRLIAGAQARGWPVASPLDDEQRGGMVMLQVPRARETVHFLNREANFVVDYRPGIVRVSPHFFNNEADIDAVLEAVAHFQNRLV